MWGGDNVNLNESRDFVKKKNYQIKVNGTCLKVT